MAYLITCGENNTLNLEFGKHKVKVFEGLYSLSDVFKASPKKYGQEYMAIIKLIEGVAYFANPDNLKKLAYVEKDCIDASCILILDEGEYSPFVGLDIKIYSEDKSAVVAFTYEHAQTAFLMGEYNKDMVKNIGEADIIIGAGNLLAQAKDELNPVIAVLTSNIDAYKKVTGVTECEHQKKVKIHVKPEDKDLMGLKVFALE